MALFIWSAVFARSAWAFDTLGGDWGWGWGLGSGPGYGGIAGAELFLHLWHFELGVGAGAVGLPVYSRLNIALIADHVLPWLRGGFGPHPFVYQLLDASITNPYTHDEDVWEPFGEGGLDYCFVDYGRGMPCLGVGGGVIRAGHSAPRGYVTFEWTIMKQFGGG